mmetsp:Transcript_22201/g.47059  ORF Transcript_22201/g.47059 Transcript_22201/m.47059 type:complete len:82 (-) Transcript_22201:165-410(-)
MKAKNRKTTQQKEVLPCYFIAVALSWIDSSFHRIHHEKRSIENPSPAMTLASIFLPKRIRTSQKLREKSFFYQQFHTITRT